MVAVGGEELARLSRGEFEECSARGVYDGATRRTVTLGAWDSPEAEQEFTRLLAERRVPLAQATTTRANTPVNEVLLAFMRQVLTHYRTPAGGDPPRRSAS